MSAKYFFLLFALFVACDQKQIAEPVEEKAVASAPEVRLVFEERVEAGTGISVYTEDSTTPWEFHVPLVAGSFLQTDDISKARILVGETLIVLGRDSRVQVFETDDEIRVVSGEVVVEGKGAAPLTILTPHARMRAEHAKTSLIVTKEETLVTVSRGEVGVIRDGETQLIFAGQEASLREGTEAAIAWTSRLGESVGWAELVAQNSEKTFDAVPRGLGKLVGRPPLSERERELELVSHKVTARIAGNIAYTEVHESFRNPTNEQLEGLYRFPLPPDAQISRLSLKVGNTWMEGEFLETAHAERIWRDIITPRRDPAILKWKQGNQFELRIFPINPKDIREVKIGYVQELAPAADGYRYVYPMASDIAGGQKAETFQFEAKLLGVSGTEPVLAQGYAAEVVRGATEDDQSTAIVRYERPEFVSTGDLSIRFNRAPQKGIDTTTEHGTIRTWSQVNPAMRGSGSDPSGFVLAAIRPEIPTSIQPKRRDFVIIADTSYSRRGLTSELQAELIRNLVDEMDRRDRVTAMACSVRCVPMGDPGFQLASGVRATQIEESIKEVRAYGTYNALEGIDVATRLLASRSEAAGREAHIIVLTDGQVSAGYLNPAEIKERAQRLISSVDAQISVVDFGGDSDSLVLRALAEAGNGGMIEVNPAEPRGAQALGVLRSHYGSMLTDLRIELPIGLVQATPPNKSALMGGEEVVLAARFDKAVSGDLVLRGKLGGEPFERRFPINVEAQTKKAHGFVPRAWASHRIAQLELEDSVRHRAEIIALSIRFGVLSRYTALLALEDQAMMDEFGVKAQKRDDWRGDEVASEVAEGSLAAAEPTAPAKGSGSAMPPMPESSGGRDFNSRAGSSAEMEAPQEPMMDEAPVGRSEKRTTSSAAPMAKSRRPTQGDGADLDDWFGGGPPSAARRPSHRPPPRRPITTFTIKTNDVSTSVSQGERSIASRESALVREPENRTYTMQLIRTLVRAQRYQDAQTWTTRWLERNSSDPEALVQQAQLLSHQGDFQKAMEFLASAADTTARGTWIQERIMKAYRARGEEALACQHEIAWNTSRNRTVTAQCELATDTTLFGLAPASLGTHIPRIGSGFAVCNAGGPGYRRGELEVTAEWSGSEQYEILIVEPDGRTLSTLSQRRNISVEQGANHRKISVPSLSSTTWQIRLVRVGDGPNSRAGGGPVKVTIKAADGKSHEEYRKGGKTMEMYGSGNVADVSKQVRYH